MTAATAARPGARPPVPVSARRRRRGRNNRNNYWLSALAIVVADDYAIGVDLPPGWLLIWGSEPGDLRMSGWAMSLADGGLVPLPDLGELFVQG